MGSPPPNTDNDSSSLQTTLSHLATLERDFSLVELDSLRQKEYSLSTLYQRRAPLLSSIPSLWSTVFSHGPSELSAVLSSKDAVIIDALVDVSVERYQIASESEGEPRSLRFTFRFDPSRNWVFEDEVVVKEFEFVAGDGMVGGLVSKPVNFKWTRKGRKEGYAKLLDLAEGLYLAEKALVGDRGKGVREVAVESGEREGLWQWEKLREALEGLQASQEEGTFLDWFGYRGVVNAVGQGSGGEKKGGEKKEENGDDEDDDDEEDEDEDDDDGMLDVEIFPPGEEVAMAIAEDLWENVMDYYMEAQEEDDDEMEFDEDDENDEDDAAPELVEFEGFEGGKDGDLEEKRPSKKQKRV